MRARDTGALLGGAVVGVIVFAAVGCSGEPDLFAPDSIPPKLVIDLPAVGGAYDRDSNGLVDVRLRWSDSVALDLSSVTIRDIWPAAGGPLGPNLVPAWRVVQLDSSGGQFEETIPGLLPAGYHRLEVSVADRARNVVTDTTSLIILPPGSYHRSIDLHIHPPCQPERATNLALTPDGRKGLVPYNHCVVVFDPDGLVPAHVVTGVPNAGFAAYVSLDAETWLAYIGGGGGLTDGFTIFDARSEAVLGTRAVGLGMASVTVHGDRIYAGEACTDGRVFVYDKRTLQEVGRIEVGARSIDAGCPNTIRFAFSSDGARAWAGMVRGGVFAFDPRALTVTSRWDVRPPLGDGNYGDVRDIELVQDRWLYASLLGEGIDEFDGATGSVTASFGDPAPPYPVVKELALSPDGRLLFASRDPNGLDTANVRAPVLLRVPGLQLVFEFPPRAQSNSDGVLFHPDGKRVFMLAEYAVDVYLVRPQ